MIGDMLRTVRELPPISIAETLSVRPGRVDLWLFFYEELEDAELNKVYRSLMTAAECARHDRFYFERDRRLFLATRALARTVLSCYADVPPAAWRFAEGERGKPYLVGPQVPVPLHFNLTNTYGLVACAVSTSHPQLGVDAELLERMGETVSIADRYFSQREVAALRRLPVQEQRRRFFSYWTLKESYIKARGLGLAIPLEQFSFLLDEDAHENAHEDAHENARIKVLFDPRLKDDARRWRFDLREASPRHLVAVGVDTGGIPLQLHAASVVPLRAGWPQIGRGT